MLDRGTLGKLGAWSGYRVKELQYLPGEGWGGRGKLVIERSSAARG